MRRRTRKGWILCLSLGFGSAAAGIVTDGTLGPGQAVPGPQYVIGETLGTRVGDNLFHSFERFSVLQGESAVFTGSADIRNVVSRVTGGDPSTINGRLRSEVGQSAFYLFNPQGILIGADAQIDVPAAFHLSTAQTLHFADGAAFVADAQSAAVLSVATPEGFGFGPDQNGVLTLAGATLALPAAEHSMTAGRLELRDARIEAPGAHLTLQAHAGAGAADGGMRFERTHLQVGARGEQPAGGIDLHADASVQIADGSQLRADTENAASAGSIRVVAPELRLDQGATESQLTGLFANALPASGGDAGSIDIATGRMAMQGVVLVDANTYGAGRAGSVGVRAEGLTLDGEGRSLQVDGLDYKAGIDAESLASGDAGRLELDLDGPLVIRNSGSLSASSFGTGRAGSLTLRAGSVSIDGRGLRQAPGLLAVATDPGSPGGGEILLRVGEKLQLLQGALVTNESSGFAAAGAIEIKAGSMEIAGGGSWIYSLAAGDGDAGAIGVQVDGAALLRDGGQIFSNSVAGGNAGPVRLSMAELTVDGGGDAATITGVRSATALGSRGDAGQVSVDVAGAMRLQRGGIIGSNTSGAGRAGDIGLRVGSLEIVGHSGMLTGISSDAAPQSRGDAGAIRVVATGPVSLQRGGAIQSNTWSVGDAGLIELGAASLVLDDASTPGLFTGLASQANPGSGGRAGSIHVTVENRIDILGGAQITSSTLADGAAGNILVDAGELLLDARQQAQQIDALTGITSVTDGGAGDAGEIEMRVEGALRILGGARISTSSQSTGDAGSLQISCDLLELSGRTAITQRFSGISSNANPGSAGDAGDIRLLARDVRISEGAQIATSTFASGDAGSISLSAERIRVSGDSDLVTGVFSQSDLLASGNAGEIYLRASDRLSIENRGRIGIDSNRLVAATGGVAADHPGLTITAGSLFLTGGALITGESTSDEPASRIRIRVEDQLSIADRSRISTRSDVADAGAIDIAASSLLLHSGQITTSVGEKAGIPVPIFGDGGDISITTDTLIMSSGFVQANTQGLAGKGGAIAIPEGNILAPWASLAVGGGESVPFVPDSGDNIIQAASRAGAPGDVRVSAPVVDVTATLVPAAVDYGRDIELGESVCRYDRFDTPSSLVLTGRGLLPVSASDVSQ